MTRRRGAPSRSASHAVETRRALTLASAREPHRPQHERDARAERERGLGAEEHPYALALELAGDEEADGAVADVSRPGGDERACGLVQRRLLPHHRRARAQLELRLGGQDAADRDGGHLELA